VSNETNGAAAVSNETVEPHEPHIQVVKGRPTDDELAALIVVLGGLGAAAPQPEQRERTAGGFQSTGCATRCRTTSGSPCSRSST